MMDDGGYLVGSSSIRKRKFASSRLAVAVCLIDRKLKLAFGDRPRVALDVTTILLHSLMPYSATSLRA